MSAFDQVRAAKARYCRHADTKQWDAFSWPSWRIRKFSSMTPLTS